MSCELDFSSRAKDRVILQTQSLTPDDYGGYASSWVTSFTAWAIVEPTSGREVYSQQIPQSRVTHKITIRYNSGLLLTQTAGQYRFNLSGRLFPIKYVHNLHKDMKRNGTDFQVAYVEEAFPSNE